MGVLCLCRLVFLKPKQCWLADLESKLPEGQQLPTKMLALMKLLESEGPVFANKELITIAGPPYPTRPLPVPCPPCT